MHQHAYCYLSDGSLLALGTRVIGRVAKAQVGQCANNNNYFHAIISLHRLQIFNTTIMQNNNILIVRASNYFQLRVQHYATAKHLYSVYILMQAYN